jgi:hypothetical protein
MGENPTPQIGIKFTCHIRWQARSLGVGVECGEKGLEMVGNHGIEHRAAGVPGFIGGNSWRHASTLRTALRVGM